MVERRDVEAALEARRELGPIYEPEVVDAFLEKVERRLAERAPAPAPAPREHRPSTPLVLGSIALGIPVTAIALAIAHGTGGIIVAIVAWLAIAAANVGEPGRR